MIQVYWPTGRLVKQPFSKPRDLNQSDEAILASIAKDFPRSPRETIAGYVIAARTLDKCRATLAGTAGEYHFDCPLDNFFFGFAEIGSNEFKDFVATGASDEEVAAWIGQKAKGGRCGRGSVGCQEEAERAEFESN